MRIAAPVRGLQGMNTTEAVAGTMTEKIDRAEFTHMIEHTLEDIARTYRVACGISGNDSPG